jgi:hypothetical protein
MLSLKVIWSSAAILGLCIAIARGAPPLTYLFLALFLAFCGVWSYYAIRLRQFAVARDDDDGSGDGEAAADGPAAKATDLGGAEP